MQIEKEITFGYMCRVVLKTFAEGLKTVLRQPKQLPIVIWRTGILGVKFLYAAFIHFLPTIIILAAVGFFLFWFGIGILALISLI